MNWFGMNSNQFIGELHETSLKLRPGTFLATGRQGEWSVKMQSACWPHGLWITRQTFIPYRGF